jgi:hypothetical protein
MRLIRRRGSAHSQFGHEPSADRRWQQTGQAPWTMPSIVWLAQATQIRGGPTCRYGQLGHLGNPGGGPAGKSVDGATAALQREGELLLLLSRLPDPLRSGQVPDHLADISDLDGSPLGDVVACPRLACR